MVVRLRQSQHVRMENGHPRHYLREWRKHRQLTLEGVAERIELLGATRPSSDPTVRPITMTHATLSRIERGLIPYGQPLLELLADIYQADVASLIRINPERGDTIYSILDTLPPVERTRVIEFAKALKNTTPAESADETEPPERGKRSA